MAGWVSGRWGDQLQPQPQRRMLWITVHLWLVDSLLPTVSEWIRQLTSALWVLPRVLSFSLPVSSQRTALLLNITSVHTDFPVSFSHHLRSLRLICRIIYSHSIVYSSTQTQTPTHIPVSTSHQHTDLFAQFSGQLIFKALLSEACFLSRGKKGKVRWLIRPHYNSVITASQCPTPPVNPAQVLPGKVLMTSPQRFQQRQS